MDAGFFTAMSIRNRYIRDLASVLFTLFYLLFPQAAIEKVKKYPTTIDVMRTSWNKATNPYLRTLSYFDRGYLKIRQNIVIQRPDIPSPSSFAYDTDRLIDGKLPPIEARIYFSGTKEQLKLAQKLVFNVHGGGFVCMEPRHHDDYLSGWARELQVPVISINYGKAPEFPYPWAIEECFDAYRSIVETNGEVLGMCGWELDGIHQNPINVVMVADSAGANIATGVLMKAIEYIQPLRLPCGFLMIYPCLSFDMSCWMSKEDMDLLHDEFKTKQKSKEEITRIMRNKTEFNLNDPLHLDDAPKSVDIMSGSVVERNRVTMSTLDAFSRGIEC